METRGKEQKHLRSGYTTGACAAAVAKAAVLRLAGVDVHCIEIPFPDGSRHGFTVKTALLPDGSAHASTIKDAGDDPDVTNGAEITATVSEKTPNLSPAITLSHCRLYAGAGVGHATKPGLAVLVGEPAINPVPRMMINEAVGEAISEMNQVCSPHIIISVTDGEILATKTLNHRLGIVGGLSILGSTGIVRPISASAWRKTVSASMDVARAAGLDEIVLATGRTSERGAQTILDLPEEAYAMMGDYLAFSLEEAAIKGFHHIHYAGMWAKAMKAALEIPQTHVRNGALEVADGAQLLRALGADDALYEKCCAANTAREMLYHIEEAGRMDLVEAVCLQAKAYCQKTSGLPVSIYLINAQAEVIFHA